MKLNTILKTYENEIKEYNNNIQELNKNTIEENYLASFREEIKTIPTNEKHLELLKIQYLLNELLLEDLINSIEYKELEVLNQYF